MRSPPAKSQKKWRPFFNPWPWGIVYFLLIGFAHCSEFDPNEKGLSGFGELTSSYLELPFARRNFFAPETPVLSAQKTIEKLKQVTDPATGDPTASAALPEGSLAIAAPSATPMKMDSPSTIKTWLLTFVDVAGLRQDWRLFQLPHPEIQGFAVRSYNRVVQGQTAVFEPSFTRCLELNDDGQCEPGIGSRLEFEMLREMERRRSPGIFESFSLHWAAKSAAKTGQNLTTVFRKVEFVSYRHAFKTTRDFSKRGSIQVLYSKDF